LAVKPASDELNPTRSDLVKSKALVLWFATIFSSELNKVYKGFWKESDSMATGIVKSGPAEVLLVPFEHIPDAVNGQEVGSHWTGAL
jgi:hypothetical protein